MRKLNEIDWEELDIDEYDIKRSDIPHYWDELPIRKKEELVCHCFGDAIGTMMEIFREISDTRPDKNGNPDFVGMWAVLFGAISKMKYEEIIYNEKVWERMVEALILHFNMSTRTDLWRALGWHNTQTIVTDKK